MGIKLAILLVYFAIMVGIGLYCRKHATDVKGFVLGGRSVGPWLTAFAYGTSYFSAVRMKLSGEQTPRDLFMQAVIADRLGMICYALSGKSAEKPVSLVNLLLGKVEMEDVRKDVVAFDTPEEFENAWKGGTG